jgi:hypothetical protein
VSSTKKRRRRGIGRLEELRTLPRCKSRRESRWRLFVAKECATRLNGTGERTKRMKNTADNQKWVSRCGRVRGRAVEHTQHRRRALCSCANVPPPFSTPRTPHQAGWREEETASTDRSGTSVGGAYWRIRWFSDFERLSSSKRGEVEEGERLSLFRTSPPPLPPPLSRFLQPRWTVRSSPTVHTGRLRLPSKDRERARILGCVLLPLLSPP